MVCCADTTMPTRALIAALAGVALAAATVSCGRSEPAEWTVAVQPLASPAGPNSSEPQIVDSGRGRILSWVERAGKTSHLKFAERSGSGWSPAVTAASGDDWFLSYADVPSVMRLGDGTLVAQWLQQVDPIRSRTTCASGTRRTTARHGRHRSFPTATARRRSTASPRSWRCRATPSVSSGSTDATVLSTSTSPTRAR